MTLVLLQLVTVAATTLLPFDPEVVKKKTAPVPCVVPKFDATNGDTCAGEPVVVDRLEMQGDVTVNGPTALLIWPFTVTCTLPVVAQTGTSTVIFVSCHWQGPSGSPSAPSQVWIEGAGTPLNKTALSLAVNVGASGQVCESAKCDPVIVTALPNCPLFVEMLVMDGVVIVKGTALLDWPLTQTITGPVRAPSGTCT